MPFALVNADDFGLHPDIDRGILDCIQAGVVGSLSFCPQGRSLNWKLLKHLQAQGVKTGLHVTLVGEPWMTRPVVLHDWRSLATKLLTRAKSFLQALEIEVHRQLQQCLDQGITPDHLDSHQHVHVLPGLWNICRNLAMQTGIARVRIPCCPNWRIIKPTPGGVVLQTLSRQRARQWDRFLPCIGLAHAGHNTADIISRELSTCAGQAVEIVVHPGINTPSLQAAYPWGFDWSTELASLMSKQFREAVEKSGYELMTPTAANPGTRGEALPASPSGA